MKVASMWSGGKDSSLATYDAIMQGHEVSDFISYSYKGTVSAKSKYAQQSTKSNLQHSWKSKPKYSI